VASRGPGSSANPTFALERSQEIENGRHAYRDFIKWFTGDDTKRSSFGGSASIPGQRAKENLKRVLPDLFDELDLPKSIRRINLGGFSALHYSAN
jgi:hypothetical protein